MVADLKDIQVLASPRKRQRFFNDSDSPEKVESNSVVEVPQFFYRYEMVYDANIALRIFYLVKATPAGYWITDENPKGDDGYTQVYRYDDKPVVKWVSASGQKRFAYPTRELALEYFIKRKESYMRHLKSRIQDLKEAITCAKTDRESILAGKIPVLSYERYFTPEEYY